MKTFLGFVNLVTSYLTFLLWTGRILLRQLFNLNLTNVGELAQHLTSGWSSRAPWGERFGVKSPTTRRNKNPSGQKPPQSTITMLKAGQRVTCWETQPWWLNLRTFRVGDGYLPPVAVCADGVSRPSLTDTTQLKCLPPCYQPISIWIDKSDKLDW